MLENLEMIGTGFGVVMLVLALIWAACALIGLFFTRGAKADAAGAAKPAGAARPAASPAMPAPGVPPHHLVAISAAVASTLGGGYRITRIMTPAHKVGNWPLEGRIQTFNGHRTRADWAAMGPPLGGAARNDSRGKRTMKRLRITVEGVAYEVTVEELDGADGAPAIAAPKPAVPASAPAPAARPAAPVAAVPAAPAVAAGPGSVPSPLAGTVVSVEVAAGQAVGAGDALLVLEAMKMNTVIGAPNAGTVDAVHVTPGSTVTEGQVLVTLS